MMRIVILDGYTENPGDLSWSGFEQLGELQVYARTSPQEVVSRIGNAEIVLTNKTEISGEMMKACPAIKYIGVLATGYNVVDVDTARKLEIAVTNIPTYGTQSVAQFAIAMLLEICCHVAHHDCAVHEGRWTNSADWCFWDMPLMELQGKTMGIVGLGRIGQATARIALALGMEVLAYDNHPDLSLRMNVRYVTLDELLACSDVVALHCPLFPDTDKLINRTTIGKMKDGAILLNNSRGQLVDEEALAEALKNGKLRAAAVDVVSKEPIEEDNPLLHAPNCIITPHISWAAFESRQRLMGLALENLTAFLKGERKNRVDG
ncbi:D-2-hydroxyacid dehydrogenase [Ruthenibacterium sp. TH_2024_36131]